MILLDTNVLIYSSSSGSELFHWARDTIAMAVAGEGASINAVSLAELCVGDEDPESVANRIREWGISILDVPAAAAEVCAVAYQKFRKRRINRGDQPAPTMPLPDFFIGAHAKVMGWPVATADRQRFKTYFPTVRLITPF